MKKRYLLSIVAMCACGIMICAQTPGSPAIVKFVKVDVPVPNQSSQGGNPAGEFYHATYTGSAWGDYDGDGYLDLFYSHNNPMINNTNTSSNLYHNNQNGTFARIAFSPFTALSFSSPAWFDMNNDGNLDMFVSGIGQGGYGWNDALTNVSTINSYLYFGNGDGTFEQINDHGVSPLFNGMTGGKAHNWVSTGDFDHDGYTDLAIAGFDDISRMNAEHPEEAIRVVRLYKNVDGQRFEQVENPLNGNTAFHGLTDGSVVMCDLDGDGWLDLFTTGYGSTRNAEAYIYWNNTKGTFTEGEPIPSQPLTDASSSVVDLNNDGLLDLVLTGVYSDTGKKHFFVCRNDGNRSFTKMEIDNLEGVDGGQIAFGDVNNDGWADIFAGGHGETHEHTTWLYLNQGDFTFNVLGAYYDDPFGKLGSFSRITHGSHHLVDVDNDGFLDAWMTGWSNGVCSRGCATQLWHNESGKKGATANVAPTPPAGLSVQHINKDGEVEFHWQAGSDEVTPVATLRYNIFVREKGAQNAFMVIPADITTGFLKVSALNSALTSCTYRMKLTPNKQYEWGVQTIDNGNLASTFAIAEFNNALSGLETMVEDDVKVEVVAGGIRYKLAGETTLTIYQPSGSVVAHVIVSGEGVLPIDSLGIYIVKAESKTACRSFKVVL